MSREDYDNRRKWADGFLSQQRSILGNVLLREPVDEKLDKQNSVDLLTSFDGINKNGFSVSLRILENKKGYLEKYGHEFTLRAHSRGPHICETERTVLQAGSADLMLFCWADTETPIINLWRLIDLSAFKAAAKKHLMRQFSKDEWQNYKFDVHDLKRMDGVRIVRTKTNQFIGVEAKPYQVSASDDGNWELTKQQTWSLKR